MESEICECGHDKEEHVFANEECNECGCKKFKAQKECEKIDLGKDTYEIIRNKKGEIVKMKKFKPKEEICECGHEKRFHKQSEYKSDLNYKCSKCPCKKFKAQNQSFKDEIIEDNRRINEIYDKDEIKNM